MNIEIKNDFEKIENYSQKLLYSEDSKRAHNLVIFLEKEIKDINLEKIDRTLFNKYIVLINKLKWVCLDFFTKEEILAMINNHFNLIFEVNDSYDIWQHTKRKLLQDLDYDKRNNLKLKIRKALKQNSSTIVKSGKVNKVNEWIGKYIQRMGEGIVPKLKKLEFFQNSHSYQQLDEDDKKKIKILIDYYERLKLSSKSLAGVEEEIMVPEEESPSTYIKDGEIIAPLRDDKFSVVSRIISKESGINSIIKNNNTENELQKLVSQYPEGSLERKAVEEEIEKLKRK